jgi:hypothetical protein
VCAVVVVCVPLTGPVSVSVHVCRYLSVVFLLSGFAFAIGMVVFCTFTAPKDSPVRVAPRAAPTRTVVRTSTAAASVLADDEEYKDVDRHAVHHRIVAPAPPPRGRDDVEMLRRPSPVTPYRSTTTTVVEQSEREIRRAAHVGTESNIPVMLPYRRFVDSNRAWETMQQ